MNPPRPPLLRPFGPLTSETYDSQPCGCRLIPLKHSCAPPKLPPAIVLMSEGSGRGLISASSLRKCAFLRPQHPSHNRQACLEDLSRFLPECDVGMWTGFVFVNAAHEDRPLL
jgi:hypothetical protein